MTTQTSFYLDRNEKLGEGEHDLIFIGRAGSFCPVKPNSGGGQLLRKETDGRLSAAAGTKGYLWQDSELIRGTDLEDCVDVRYFDKLVEKAKDAISKYGDYNWFVSDNSDIPWMMPCGDSTMDSCLDCPHFQKKYDLCDLNFDISSVLSKYTKEN
jgi:hypothetical protein